MSRYEQRYGLVAEHKLMGWEEEAHAGAISAEEFESPMAGRPADLAGRHTAPGMNG